MKRNYLGEFEEIVLLFVAVQHDKAYGFSITRAIEKEFNRSVTMSSVHTALDRLQEKGYVDSRLGDTSTEREGRKNRLFTITTQGKVALKSQKTLLDWRAIYLDLLLGQILLHGLWVLILCKSG